DYLRRLPRMTRANVVTLRGNHEDAWLHVRQHGWRDFVRPPAHGCLAAYRSFVGGPVPGPDEHPLEAEVAAFEQGTFFPPDVVSWLQGLPYWYEDEHAIYVHAGLPKGHDGGFVHPRQLPSPPIQVLWLR